MSNGIPSLCEFIKLCKCFTFPLLNISVNCDSEMKRIDNGEQLEFLAIFVNIFFLHLCQNIYLYRFQHIHLDFYLCVNIFILICVKIFIFIFLSKFILIFICVSTSLSQASLPGEPPRPTSASSGV